MEILGGGTSGEGIPVLIDLFQRLSAHYEIVFYCFHTIDKSKVPAAIKVRHVVPWRIPGRMKFFLLIARLILDHFRKPVSLIFAVSAYPTGQWAVIIGKIIKRPAVVQYIALEAVALTDIGQGNLTIPWLKKITQRVSQKADVLVAVADYQKELAKKNLPTQRAITVLPLRIDHRKFFYKERNISHPVQFIHIAYYSAIKDQDTMFRTFGRIAAHVDCHLTVIGDGFAVPQVQILLDSLNISNSVTFTGRINQTEIPKYLDTAHILLHTARFETGCAVIQEAMASGVAVGGTRVGILADIGDQYAAIAPPGNAEELANKILMLIKNPAHYRQMTKAAYQWISAYDAVWAAQNYHRFIENILARKNRF
jgi:glycosyltransferase involved in cell wall biosynthesis